MPEDRTCVDIAIYIYIQLTCVDIAILYRMYLITLLLLVFNYKCVPEDRTSVDITYIYIYNVDITVLHRMQRSVSRGPKFWGT